MQVLFIAPYRESTGWGEASRRIIIDMYNSGVDVVLRCIKLGTKTPELNPVIEKLENKLLNNITHVIQCCLPHHMEWFPGVVNIGAPFIDTNTLSHPIWLEKLKSMDYLWLFDFNDTLSGLCGNKIRFINVPAKNMQKKPRHKQDSCKFYFVGEFNRRKNIAQLIECFHLAFRPEEPVELTLKLNKPNMDIVTLTKEVESLISTVKNNLRLRTNYKPEIVVLGDISDEQVDSIHYQNDVFITTSFGEAWCLPAQDAAVCGNYVLGSKHGVDFIRYPTPCMGHYDTFDGILTANDWYTRPDYKNVIDCMRSVKNYVIGGVPATHRINYKNDYRKLLDSCILPKVS